MIGGVELRIGPGVEMPSHIINADNITIYISHRDNNKRHINTLKSGVYMIAEMQQDIMKPYPGYYDMHLYPAEKQEHIEIARRFPLFEIYRKGLQP